MIDTEEVYELDEDDELENEIFLTVPQTKFIQSKEKYPLFVAGFGSGKSTCMCVNIIADLQYPGADVAAYAPTYDLLKLITIPYLEEFLTVSEIPYKLNKSDYIIQVEGYGRIICRSLDNPARIVGYQTFRAHIDELDTVEEKKAEESWNKVIARNRQKIYKLNDQNRRIISGFKENGKPKYTTELNRVSAYTTPEGFRFCYKRWVKKKEPGYAIYKAPTMSNIDNLPEDYIDSLRSSYPAELIEAYLEGEFVNLTSGAVYPGFDRTLSHTDETVSGNEPIYIGMDFNVLRGAAVVAVIRDDLPVIVDEIHNAYDTDDQISIIKNRYPNNPINVYPDSAGKNRTSSNTVQTDIAKLDAAGFNTHYDYTNPAIKDRVASVNAMILNGVQERRLKVNTVNCPHLTDALEQQVWGDNGLPDKKAGLDHITDALGYYIWQEYPIIRQTTYSTVVRGRY